MPYPVFEYSDQSNALHIFLIFIAFWPRLKLQQLGNTGEST